MPRRKRTTTAGVVFHAVNRGSRRGDLFENAADYNAFEQLLREGVQKFSVQLFSYSLLPNHWHFITLPAAERILSCFLKWLAGTHAVRWRVHTGTVGQGAVYQGRFKAIPVQADSHLLWVLRYVERNACQASLVDRAEDWRWCSLWRREHNADTSWLAPWPVPRPENWLELVNTPQTARELARFRRLRQRGEPFGSRAWQQQMMTEAGRWPRRPRGRPRRKTVLVK
jgi:putative transposase